MVQRVGTEARVRNVGCQLGQVANERKTSFLGVADHNNMSFLLKGQ